jgi:hypothetical protein
MHTSIDQWLADKLSRLEEVYQAGNLGALKDAIYWCREYQKPLPEWANLALKDTINSLAKGDKDTPKAWKKWFRQWRQAMADYSVWSDVKDVREHGSDWEQIYNITAGIQANSIPEKDTANTIEKAYKRVKRRMEENPFQYYLLKTFQIHDAPKSSNPALWVWAKNIIKNNCKPKALKKQ